MGAFQAFHRREPTEEEHLEIVGLVERRSAEIRELFAALNPGPGGPVRKD